MIVLDDASRRILSWRLQSKMNGEAFSEAVQDALKAMGLENAPPPGKPRLLSGNGSWLVGEAFREYGEGAGMAHTLSSLYPP